jgi:transcriptional regulator with XRE-family HTH domain
MEKQTKSGNGEKIVRDPLLVAIGARIKQIRADIGMTQKDLGDRAGVSPAYIYMVETGGQNITITVMVRLARALGTSIEELLAGSAERVAPTEASIANYTRILETLIDLISKARKQDEEVVTKLLGVLNARRDDLSMILRELEKLSSGREALGEGTPRGRSKRVRSDQE